MLRSYINENRRTSYHMCYPVIHAVNNLIVEQRRPWRDRSYLKRLLNRLFIPDEQPNYSVFAPDGKAFERTIATMAKDPRTVAILSGQMNANSNPQQTSKIYTTSILPHSPHSSNAASLMIPKVSTTI